MAHKFWHVGVGDDKRHRLLAIELDADHDDKVHADAHLEAPISKAVAAEIADLKARVTALEAAAGIDNDTPDD